MRSDVDALALSDVNLTGVLAQLTGAAAGCHQAVRTCISLHQQQQRFAQNWSRHRGSVQNDYGAPGRPEQVS